MSKQNHASKFIYCETCDCIRSTHAVEHGNGSNEVCRGCGEPVNRKPEIHINDAVETNGRYKKTHLTGKVIRLRGNLVLIRTLEEKKVIELNGYWLKPVAVLH